MEFNNESLEPISELANEVSLLIIALHNLLNELPETYTEDFIQEQIALVLDNYLDKHIAITGEIVEDLLVNFNAID